MDHETDHAVDDLKHPGKKQVADKQYDNKEERRVITGREQKAAVALGLMRKGQVTRKEHRNGTLFPTSGPNSTVVDDNEWNKYRPGQTPSKKEINYPKRKTPCIGCDGPARNNGIPKDEI